MIPTREVQTALLEYYAEEAVEAQWVQGARAWWM